MALEKWTAITSVGLFAMFVGEIVSIFHFMMTPLNVEFPIAFEPTPKILQFISIGVAPASILAGLSFILSKRYGSKQIGALIDEYVNKHPDRNMKAFISLGLLRYISVVKQVDVVIGNSSSGIIEVPSFHVP
ncbi:MAG: UDP-N-acetylglucosamine 2-epimerase, partial [Nitrosarchaeum sp.]